jgi:tetratricopeptide (TPR) repeat protein
MKVTIRFAAFLLLVFSVTAGALGQKTETPDERAKREELARKNAVVAAENEKIVRENDAVTSAFKAGNEALSAKRYEEAIKRYDAGLATAPDHPGASTLLTNKSAALKARGAERYNAGVSGKNEALKNAGLKDFVDAAASAERAVALIKAYPEPADPTERTRYSRNRFAAVAAFAESLRLVALKVDNTKAAAAYAAYKEYWLLEALPAKKLKLRLDAAELLLTAGSFADAAAEYKYVLTLDRDNPDALFGAAMALGATEDKGQKAEALQLIERYLAVAPADHQFRSDARALLEFLKN